MSFVERFNFKKLLDQSEFGILSFPNIRNILKIWQLRYKNKQQTIPSYLLFDWLLKVRILFLIPLKQEIRHFQGFLNELITIDSSSIERGSCIEKGMLTQILSKDRIRKVATLTTQELYNYYTRKGAYYYQHQFRSSLVH